MQSKTSYYIAKLATERTIQFRWIDATKSELSAVRRLIRDGIAQLERTDKADTVNLTWKSK